MSRMIEGGSKYRKTAEVVFNWKKHFALTPILIHGKKYWLTTVYRRKISSMWRAGKFTKEKIKDVYEYGTIFDVMKE